MSYRVVFFGTPDISKQVLEHLVEKGVEVCTVVTMPDRPKGRSKEPQPSAVKLAALEHDIPLLQPENASTTIVVDQLKKLDPDFFIVIGFGQILKPELLAVPKIAAINIHVSLLPKYRGAAPIQRAIMAGESEMGITIMLMNPKMDAGAMLKKASAKIDRDALFPEVEQIICNLAKGSIIEILEDYKAERIEPIEQNVAEVTLAPKIKPSDCELDFSRSARELHNQVRALSPKPGAVFTLYIDGNPKKIKVLKSEVVESVSVLSLTKKGLAIECREEALNIVEMQLEGKAKSSGEQFYSGYQGKRLTLQ